MSDDWRVRANLHTPSHATELRGYLEAAEAQHELETALGDRAVVTYDDAEVFCYTGTREQAERAQDLIRSIAADHGWDIETELKRWHPVAEEWEDRDAPLPAGGAEREAEHAALIQREREEALATGYVEFEIRVEFHSHRDAVELARRLEDEGIPNVRRWRYLVIGAADEDAAQALAERIRAEAPPDATVRVEGTPRLVRESEPSNWFSIFAGLGG
jgi:hypothetical protein